MDELEKFRMNVAGAVDYAKITKAVKMLKKERHLMFIERGSDGITGIVKSQTNPDLEYSVIIKENGNHICGTQNLRRCGGLRNGICKHAIMLTMAAVKGGIISGQEGVQWLQNSQGKYSHYNRTQAEEIFTRFRNPVETNIEFREVEILAEDLMAF